MRTAAAPSGARADVPRASRSDSSPASHSGVRREPYDARTAAARRPPSAMTRSRRSTALARLARACVGWGVVALPLVACALSSACATGRYASNGTAEAGAAADGPADELPDSLFARPVAAGASTREVLRVRRSFPTGDPRTSAVTLEKEVPAEVVRLTPFSYRIRVENLTEGVLEHVRVSDRLPEGLSVEATEPVGTIEGGMARWDLGMLAPRAVKTLVVHATASQVGALTSSATVEYEAALEATTRVVAPDLQVSVDAPGMGQIAQPFDLTVKVTNAGSGGARDVRAIDVLPDGLRTVSGQSRIVLDFGELAAQQTKEKTIRLVAEAPRRFRHEVSVEAAGGIAVTAESKETAVQEARLVLDVREPEEPARATPLRVDIVIGNTGDGTSERTTLRCALPDGVELVSADAESELDGRVVTWDLGDLAPGGTRTVNLTVWCDAAGTYVSEIRANGGAAAEGTATWRLVVE